MSTHTSGPWRTGGAGEAVFSGHGASAEVVCVMRAQGVQARLDDARLIAAAPELLATLEAAADTLADFRQLFRMLGEDLMIQGCDIAENACRAVIAKATGAAS